MESTSKKTVKRSNKMQIDYLCKYMCTHPEFAAGDYKSPQGARKINEEWAKVKEALDAIGPERSVEQWKICWRDQKRKARSEGGALSQAQNATGNTVEVPEISNNAVMVLSAIGQDMAVGMGPEESPIGLTHVMETQPRVTPAPKSAPRTRAPTQRAPRTLPADRFLNAQLELNQLIRELIVEIRRSNDIRMNLI